MCINNIPIVITLIRKFYLKQAEMINKNLKNMCYQFKGMAFVVIQQY